MYQLVVVNCRFEFVKESRVVKGESKEGRRQEMPPTVHVGFVDTNQIQFKFHH